MDEARLILIQDHLKFKHRFIAPRRNKLGGLVMYWKEEVDLIIYTFSKNHIDATICKNKEGGVEIHRFLRRTGYTTQT